MITFVFDKEFAEQCRRGLEQGCDLRVTRAWTRDRLMILMGVAYGLVFRDRVRADCYTDDLGPDGRQFRPPDEEKEQPRSDKLHADLHKGLVFAGMLAEWARRDDYDRQFAPALVVAVYQKENEACGFDILAGEKTVFCDAEEARRLVQDGLASYENPDDSQNGEGEEWKKGATG